MVYKSLHGMAPSYFGDDCVLASSDKFRRHLRSADVDTCIVPRTRTRFGDRSFPAAGPQIWKTGTACRRNCDGLQTSELGEFRRLLKTFCLHMDSDSVIMAWCTSFSYYYIRDFLRQSPGFLQSTVANTTPDLIYATGVSSSRVAVLELRDRRRKVKLGLPLGTGKA